MKKLSKEKLVKIMHVSTEMCRIYGDGIILGRNGMRSGQAFFNVLLSQFPDIAEEIRATEYDPFYDDTKIMKCCEYLVDEKEEEKDPEVFYLMKTTKYKYIKCIDNENIRVEHKLGLNQIYAVLDENEVYYWIAKKDKTGLVGYEKKRFIDVSRSIKIKRIINQK